MNDIKMKSKNIYDYKEKLTTLASFLIAKLKTFDK